MAVERAPWIIVITNVCRCTTGCPLVFVPPIKTSFLLGFKTVKANTMVAISNPPFFINIRYNYSKGLTFVNP